MVTEKIETLVVFMEGKKKIKPPGAQAGPFSASGGISSRRPVVGAKRQRLAAVTKSPPEAEKGLAWAPGGFIFFFAFHEYHQSFNFFCHHFREYHPKFKQ